MKCFALSLASAMPGKITGTIEVGFPGFLSFFIRLKTVDAVTIGSVNGCQNFVMSILISGVTFFPFESPENVKFGCRLIHTIS